MAGEEYDMEIIERFLNVGGRGEGGECVCGTERGEYWSVGGSGGSTIILTI